MLNNMIFEVAFIPGEVRNRVLPVCVLIDAIRASSTIVTLFEKGCKEVLLTRDEAKSLEIDERMKSENFCICAETAIGDRAECAHFSPSLEKMDRINYIHGKTILLRTTNGTAGVHTLCNLGIKDIFIGCMLNAEAVMTKAVEQAKKLQTGITIVCAGRENGTTYTIDDVYCAAKLLQYGIKTAEENGIKPDIQDSAKIATHLLSIYDDTFSAFNKSASGDTMRRINCNNDIMLCARENISNIAPKIFDVDEYGHVIVKSH